VAVNGKKLEPAQIVETLNQIGGKHGIGKWIWSRTGWWA